MQDFPSRSRSTGKKRERVIKLTSNAIPDKLETEIYKDVAKPSMQIIGQAAAGPIKLLATPFALAGYAAELLQQKGSLWLDEKLKNVPVEEQIAPKPTIAVPAIQGLVCAMEEAELKDSFMNLLANAMTSQKSSLIHTSFPYLLQQMSPLDALIFKEIFCASLPIGIACIIGKELSNPTNTIMIFRHFTKLKSCPNIYLLALSLTNLQRLNLIHLDYDSFFTDIPTYDELEQHLEFLAVQKNYQDKYNVALQKGILELTVLGNQFGEVTLQPPQSPRRSESMP